MPFVPDQPRVQGATPGFVADPPKPPGFFEGAANLINRGYSAFTQLPVIKQASQAVGTITGGIAAGLGGAIGVAAAPFQVGSNIALGKPLFQNVGGNIVSLAKPNYEFGYKAGEAALPGAILGEFGGILPNAAVAYGQGYQGYKDIKTGITDQDPALALQGGLALGTSLWATRGAVEGIKTNVFSPETGGGGLFINKRLPVREKVAAPFEKSFQPDTAKLFTEVGVTEPPVSATTKSKFLQQQESLAAKGVRGEDVYKVIETAKNQLEDFKNKAVADITPEIEASAASVGRDIGMAYQNYKEVFKKTQERVYDDFLTRNGNLAADLTKTTKTVQDVLGQLRSSLYPDNFLMKKIEQFDQNLKSRSGTANFADLKATRTKIGEELNKTGSPQLKQLYGAISDDMDVTVSRVDKRLGTELETISQNYKNGVKQIESNVGMSIERSNPEKLVTNLVKPNNSITLAKVREMVGDENFGNLRDLFLKRQLEKAYKFVGAEKVFDVNMFKRAMNKFDNATMEVLLGPEGVKRLDEAIQKMEKYQTLKKAMQPAEKIREGSQTAFLAREAVRSGGVLYALGSIFRGDVRPLMGYLSLGLSEHAMGKLFSSRFGRKYLGPGYDINSAIQKKALPIVSKLKKMPMGLSIEEVGTGPTNSLINAYKELKKIPVGEHITEPNGRVPAGKINTVSREVIQSKADTAELTRKSLKHISEKPDQFPEDLVARIPKIIENPTEIRLSKSTGDGGEKRYLFIEQNGRPRATVVEVAIDKNKNTVTTVFPSDKVYLSRFDLLWRTGESNVDNVPPSASTQNGLAGSRPEFSALKGDQTKGIPTQNRTGKIGLEDQRFVRLAYGDNVSIPDIGKNVKGQSKLPPLTPEFKGFKDLSTKVLDKLKGRSTVSKQFIQDLTNSPNLKQAERDLIRKTLDDMGEKQIHGQDLDVMEKFIDYARLKKPKDLNLELAASRIAENYNLKMPKTRSGLADVFEVALNNKSRDTISVKDFAEKVKTELLPLKVKGSDPIGVDEAMRNIRAAESIGDFRRAERITAQMEESDLNYGTKYENISLPDELRGPVANYKERIYESPIKTSAGSVHFNNASDNYFAHTRIEDLANDSSNMQRTGLAPDGHSRYRPQGSGKNTTRRIIELQSDLFQKGRLEGEGRLPSFKDDGDVRLLQEKVDAAKAHLESIKRDGTFTKNKIMDAEDELTDAGIDLQQAKKDVGYRTERQAELAKLEPYRNTWHERIIREEVKQAAKDKKTKLQFPTGETAMKIEGLGVNAENWLTDLGSPNPSRLSLDGLFVGNEIGRVGEQEAWIITDVLGDGKFKAVPKDSLIRSKISVEELLAHLERIKKEPKYSGRLSLDAVQEQFDISGKVDTNNPIYRFYEKEVGRYLKNKYNAQLFTDPQGVSWWQVDIKPEYKKLPIEAYGTAALLLGGSQALSLIPKKKKEEVATGGK